MQKYKGYTIGRNLVSGMWAVYAPGRDIGEIPNHNASTRDSAREWVTNSIEREKQIEANDAMKELVAECGTPAIANAPQPMSQQTRRLAFGTALEFIALTSTAAIDLALETVIGPEIVTPGRKSKPRPALYGTFLENVPQPERVHFGGLTTEQVRAQRKARKDAEREAKAKPNKSGNARPMFSKRRRPHL